MANKATTNCSELIEDLNLLYNSHFGSGLNIETINATKIRLKDDLQKQEFAATLDSVPEQALEVYKRLDDDAECNTTCKEMNGVCKKSGDTYRCQCESDQKLIQGKCISK